MLSDCDASGRLGAGVRNDPAERASASGGNADGSGYGQDARGGPARPQLAGGGDQAGCSEHRSGVSSPVRLERRRGDAWQRHIFSLTPMRMSQALTGQAVKNPRIIASCIIIQ